MSACDTLRASPSSVQGCGGGSGGTESCSRSSGNESLAGPVSASGAHGDGVRSKVGPSEAGHVAEVFEICDRRSWSGDGAQGRPRRDFCPKSLHPIVFESYRLDGKKEEFFLNFCPYFLQSRWLPGGQNSWKCRVSVARLTVLETAHLGGRRQGRNYQTVLKEHVSRERTPTQRRGRGPAGPA